MKPLRLCILTSLILTLAGCRNSDPFENIVTADMPRAFNYVTSVDARSGSGSVFDDVTYSIVFDDTRRTANLTISNLRVSEDATPLTLTFSDVEMTYTSDNHEKERMIKADVLISDDPVNSGTAITDVEIVYTKSNDLDPNGTSGIYASYVVDGRYQVMAYPYSILADGTTRVDVVGGEAEQIDYAPVYRLSIRPSQGRADLTVDGLSIGGCRMSLSFHGLVFALTDDGYTLDMGDSVSCNGDVAVDLLSFSATARLRDELRIEMVVCVDDVSYRVSGFLTPNLTGS